MSSKTGYVATIGMFDGVHLGHQFVLGQVRQTALLRALQPMVITFDHTLRPDPILTTLQEKLALIARTGIERTEVLSFTDALKQMTAREFMQQVLKNQLDVDVLLTGYDNRFGYHREEGFDDYVRYGRQMGIEVLRLPAEGNVSSSMIRSLLREGRVAEATAKMGHPYMLEGSVAHGEHIGTQLGFPTANLEPTDPQKLVPSAGVYAVWASVGGQSYHAMMNIGQRPTFDGHRTTLEVHVLHLNADLYGQRLTIQFIQRLRDEQRFSSAEALRQQLLHDAEAAEQVLTQTEQI